MLKFSKEALLSLGGKNRRKAQDFASLYKRQKEAHQRRRVIIKTEEQIEGIRKSSALTAEILDMLEERVKPGVTTEQIDRWVYELHRRARGDARAAQLSRLSQERLHVDQRGCLPRHPGDRELMDGDIINIDVTSILDGYYGDSSRMFLIGNVSEAAKRLVEITRECLYLGIEQVKPGNTLGDIGHAIQQHAEAHGYSVVRKFVGHGTGVRFHEPPDVFHFGTPGTGLKLRPNMVFTIEPMVNVGTHKVRILEDDWTAVTIDGELSAQWEHTLRVTEDGVEILTESRKS